MMSEWPPHPRCGLPVLRLHIDEDRDEWARSVEPCGEQLFLETASSEWIDNDGPTGPDATVWKLSCLGGHVLMVPDDEGNENYGSMSFLWDEALAAIGHLLHAEPG